MLCSEQLVLLTDPGRCPPVRFRSLSLSGSHWIVQSYRIFPFIKCPLVSLIFLEFTFIPWLSDWNDFVVAIPSEDWERIKSLAMAGWVHNWIVLVPSTAFEFRGNNMLIGADLTSRKCNVHGAVCGFKEDKCLATTRTNWAPEPEPEPEGNPQNFELLEDLPKSDAAKLQALIGIGLPLLLVISCACCYISRKVQLQDQARRNQTDPATSTRQVEAVFFMTGLDTTTIESYPKSQIGDEGSQLPGDGTCSICLTDYRPEETVRVIPECNHYFHAHCIDPWLKRNASCPLCRNHQGSIDSVVSS